jgi:hypothetical protein
MLNIKACILTILATLLVSFSIGCFVNMNSTTSTFSKDTWFYVNRGYPVAWAGVALKEKGINLPIVAVPFLQKDEYVKVIDLKIFIPLFLLSFLFLYLPAFIFTKAVDENKKLFPFFVVVNVSILLCFLFVYFFLFSRI